MFLRSVFVNTWWKVKNVSELSLRELKVTALPTQRGDSSCYVTKWSSWTLVHHQRSCLYLFPLLKVWTEDRRAHLQLCGGFAQYGESQPACVFINCALWAFYKVYRKPGRGRYGRGWGTVRQTCQCAREMHRPPRLGGMGSSAICALVFSAGTFCLCDLWICFM